ncbi:MAG: hypothetical protein QME66_04560 [Candidatus Eisenbacteria bacterium]|nr:hypothetical protein [Candidatus Eisenbacteria bacterium]
MTNQEYRLPSGVSAVVVLLLLAGFVAYLAYHFELFGLMRDFVGALRGQ